MNLFILEYFQMEVEGLKCPVGYEQVMDQSECRNNAFDILKKKGDLNIVHSQYLGTWSDHVPGCFEGYGSWNGGPGNGNLHFGTNGASTGSRGYRICKLSKYFQMDVEGVKCPAGSEQVMDQNECSNKAFDDLKEKGDLNVVHSEFKIYRSDHVPGCLEGHGSWNGGPGNGNLHFGTNSESTGSKGYRICKQQTRKRSYCFSPHLF